MNALLPTARQQGSSVPAPGICIAGMHRSGTSMVARLAREAGLDLGREADLTPAKQENPDGFWENVRFVSINDEILAARGGAWDSPVPIHASDVSDALRTRAEILALDFNHGRPWGWKDPRNSLTLEFWRSIFPEMKLIVCVRNPLEVALSLSRRNLFSYESSLKLWLEYSRRILAGSTEAERMVVHYDAFFSSPRTEIRRMIDYSGLSPSSIPTLDAGVIKPELRNNRLTIENLIACEVRSDVLETYLDLCSEAGWIDSQKFTGAPSREMVADLISGVRSALGGRLDASGPLLNRAALERDIYMSRVAELEATLVHLTAQRDWHSDDRDKLARIVEEHEAAAISQQAIINDLTSRLSSFETKNELMRDRLGALENVKINTQKKGTPVDDSDAEP